MTQNYWWGGIINIALGEILYGKFFKKNERIYIIIAWYIILLLIGIFCLFNNKSFLIGICILLSILGIALIAIYIQSAIKLYNNKKYEKRNAIILLLTGGSLQRFYNKQILIGILYILTFDFFFIGFIYDLVLICTDKFKSDKFLDEKKETIENVSEYDKTTLSILCLLLGLFGVHNFYCGKIAKGIIYLLTFGFLGIGTFVDLINIINNNYKDARGLFVIK